MTINEEQTAYF